MSLEEQAGYGRALTGFLSSSSLLSSPAGWTVVTYVLLQALVLRRNLTSPQVVFGKVLEGMDIVHAIGEFDACVPRKPTDDDAENVAKGRNDKPEKDVVIVECGEVCHCVFCVRAMTDVCCLMSHSFPLTFPSTKKAKRCRSTLSFKSSRSADSSALPSIRCFAHQMKNHIYVPSLPVP